MEQIAHRLRSRLEVDTEFGSFLGDTRIRLLEAIDQHGSITRAAKAVPLAMKTIARNPLWGEIQRIHDGPVNSEVRLALPGKRSVCAVVTHDGAASLGLAVGSEASAVCKASAVILCLYS